MDSRRKTRKPLVQGKLFTPDIDPGVDSSPKSRTSNSKSNGSGHHSGWFGLEQHSHTSNNSNDADVDPILSPRRTIPQLTEHVSPRPEPPLVSLDLSDVDLDVKDDTPTRVRAGRVKQGQPVIVYDASQAGSDSPHSTEVSLSVALEASPARVVCHAEKLRNSPRNMARNYSPRQTFSPLAVKVIDSSHRSHGGVASGKKGKPDRLARTLFADTEEDELDDVNDDSDEVIFNFKKGDGQDMHISHASRGIIEEILAEEMNGKAVSPQNVRDVSSKAEVVECFSSLTTPTKHEKGDYDDVTSTASDACSLHEFSVPKNASSDSHPEKENKTANNASQSSLKKSTLTNSLSRSTTKTNTQSSSTQTPTKVKVKKKATRQVASRYMQSSLHRKTNLTNNSSANLITATSNSSGSAVGKHPRTTAAVASSERSAASLRMKQKLHPNFSSVPNIHAAKESHMRSGTLKTGSTVRHSSLRSATPKQFAVKGEAVGGGNGDNRNKKTSTPTADHSTLAPTPFIDASAIQPAFSVLNFSNTFQFDSREEEEEDNRSGDKFRKVMEESGFKTESKVKMTGSKSHGAGNGGEKVVTQHDLDCAYTRYLQWQFLLSRAQKAFENQQAQATAQLNALWKLCEAKRRQEAQLVVDVDRLKSMVLLDNVLDEQEPELSKLVDGLLRVSDDHTQLVSALDNTRHQLPVTEVYLPPGGTESCEAMAERLASALEESNRLLGDIEAAAKASDKDCHSNITKYLACVEAIEQTATATAKEVEQLEKDLTAAGMVSTRLASFTVQDMQTNL